MARQHPAASGEGDIEPAASPEQPAVPADATDVFVANHRAMLAFLERRVGSRAVAEDLLQDAFVRGIGAVSSNTEESMLAWYYRTLRNAAVDHHRRHASATRALDAFAAESPTASADPELHEAVCQCVARLAQTLKPDQAEILRRVEVDGVSVKDYAAEAGISASNAGVRIFRAREALRAQVSRSCGTCATHGCFACTCRAG